MDNSLLFDIINQLIRVSLPEDKIYRKEHIEMLAPICQVSDGESAPYEPDGTFLVGKVTPKGKKLIFEDMIFPINSIELHQTTLNYTNIHKSLVTKIKIQILKFETRFFKFSTS